MFERICLRLGALLIALVLCVPVALAAAERAALILA